MTAKKNNRRSFDCVWRKSAPDSAQDDNNCWAALRMTAKNKQPQVLRLRLAQERAGLRSG